MFCIPKLQPSWLDRGIRALDLRRWGSLVGEDLEPRAVHLDPHDDRDLAVVTLHESIEDERLPVGREIGLHRQLSLLVWFVAPLPGFGDVGRREFACDL